MLGVMFVKCKGGCLSLFPHERFNFPPDCESQAVTEETPNGVMMEPEREGRVGTYEGGEASKNVHERIKAKSESEGLPF